jgi:hypothetical protein
MTHKGMAGDPIIIADQQAALRALEDATVLPTGANRSST